MDTSTEVGGGSATIAEVRRALDAGSVSSQELTQAALERMADAEGEGPRAITRAYPASAMAAAKAADLLHAVGVAAVSPLAGVPVSIKDLFDVAGETTTSGTPVLANRPAAVTDAIIVRRLRRAGAVIAAKTNQSPFAFHALGINSHFGTPRCPWERSRDPGGGRIPGGSSSGAAVSVADRMVVAAVGTDTGGSVRIPAAFCGITGFKPTARRVPMAGCLPLSPCLDSIGPLAPSVACCIAMDAVLAGRDLDQPLPVAVDPATFSLVVATNTLLDDLDEAVATAFDRALSRLSVAGIRIRHRRLDGLDRITEIAQLGGMVPVEIWQNFGPLIRANEERMDPLVLARAARGEGVSAIDWLSMIELRRCLIEETWRAVGPGTFIVCPTTPLLAPLIATALAPLPERAALNARILRNTMIGNYLDATSISIPCQQPGDGPVGLMLTAVGGTDDALLAAALTVESVVRQ